MQIPRIRDLNPEVKKQLIQINKDKKNWYRNENLASIERSGKPLFKTSFHDYAHSAPISIANKNPISLSNEGENTARYLEDHILQKLPGSIPKSLDTDRYNDLITQGRSGATGQAYDALYELGKYSVAKKKGIPIDNVTGSQVMLNKFSYMNNILYI